MTYIRLYIILIGIALLLPISGQAETCSIENRTCLLGALESAADGIENQNWKDQSYRELSKTLAFDGNVEEAITVLNKIQNPDTKALTIRGIGMAVADNDLPPTDYKAVFKRLRLESEKIDHPPSYAIALTYIAMAQAFAGDNEGAWATAADMENDALRHKAYGETAEIQAEQGNFEAAMKSIAFIDSKAFRNKAYGIVSKILADGEQLQAAFDAAKQIDNAYKRAAAIQYVLDKQKPREIPYQ